MRLSRRGSPVRIGTKFKLKKGLAVNKFINLGFQCGNESISHSLFLSKPLVQEEVMTIDAVIVSGICNYRYIVTPGSTVIYGILFSTPMSKSLCTEYKLIVTQYEGDKTYVPTFDLEKLGLLYYLGSDSSVIIIPTHIDFRLLVKADH